MMLKTALHLCLIVVLLVSTGCFGSKQSDSGAAPPVQTMPREETTAPAPVQTPPIVAPKNPPPNINVPDAFNRRQQSIAKFQDGSNICVLYGREEMMDGCATLKKFKALIPLKELVRALNISTDYVAHDGKLITIRTQGKTFEIPSYVDANGTVYVTESYWSMVKALGYGLRQDKILGIAEIMGPLPLTDDDLRIDELSFNMSLDKIWQILGPPKCDGGDLRYPGLSIDLDSTAKAITFSVYSDRYPTYRGIKVGDSLSKVFELYGRAYYRFRPGIFEYDFPRDVRPVYLAFEVDEDGKVKKIVLQNYEKGGPHYVIGK